MAAKLKSEGYAEATIYEKVLLGITKMEKAIGKKLFADLLGDLVVKPAGAPTLAPESDKRKPYNQQQQLIDSIVIPEGIEGENLSLIHILYLRFPIWIRCLHSHRRLSQHRVKLV